MLDIMRKHASSWLIKVILGAIIVTFVFFFGYSSFRKGMKGGRVGAQGGIAAKVNGTPVSESEFSFFFDRNFERMKSQFEGKEIPDFVRKIAESSTMQQLVGREVMLQQADALGLVIPDDELADTIREGQAAQSGGEFDPIAYRHQFLPYFRNRYNMDYEQFVRQDLRIGALQKLFAQVDATTPTSKDGDDSFTFESVTLDPKAMVESKLVASEDEAKKIADRLAAANPSDWPKIIKQEKLAAVKTGPIKIAQRAQLLGGSCKFEDYEAIFALTKDSPVTKKPLSVGGKLAVVRFVEKKDDAKKDDEDAQRGPFFEEWMGKLLAKAKVQNYAAKGKQQQ